MAAHGAPYPGAWTVAVERQLLLVVAPAATLTYIVFHGALREIPDAFRFLLKYLGNRVDCGLSIPTEHSLIRPDPGPKLAPRSCQNLRTTRYRNA